MVVRLNSSQTTTISATVVVGDLIHDPARLYDFSLRTAMYNFG
jgi:hypothetical protein